MFVQTHWLIGETVARITDKKIPDSINPLGYRWGNILPDLARPYNQIPHNPKDSLFLVDHLLQQAQSATFQNRWSFSLHLGIISHFICDYFCLAHNAPALMDLIPHTVYETRLLSRFKPEKLRCLARAFLRQDIEVADLLTFLEVKHQEYLKTEEGPETDMVFAIQAVTVIVSNLMNQRGVKEVLAA